MQKYKTRHIYTPPGVPVEGGGAAGVPLGPLRPVLEAPVGILQRLVAGHPSPQLPTTTSKTDDTDTQTLDPVLRVCQVVAWEGPARGA